MIPEVDGVSAALRDGSLAALTNLLTNRFVTARSLRSRTSSGTGS
jgi:hypothetical protein